MDKRTFIKQFSALSMGAPFTLQHLDQLVATKADVTPAQLAQDETFWKTIRKGYRLKDEYINLENGYYCIQPEETLENFIQHVREVNYQGSYYMRTVQWENKKKSSEKLAAMAGCSPEELVITRNTTESLDLIIAGVPWQEGDEAVMAEQDYGAMLNQFTLMESRHGIVAKRVSLPNHPNNDEEIVDLYAAAITEKTRLLMVCHLVNITGQVLPIRKICDMAHSKGVEVMVDGAHAFAHLDFNIPDLDCDYYGTSLHKWLSVPLGAGFLYVKKGKANNITPLLAEGPRDADDITRLNHIGTHPVHTDLTILNAIDFHNKIGTKRKEARLKYLQDYWTSKVRDLPQVNVNTPKEMERHGAIGNVGIEGMEPSTLAKKLLDEHNIWTVAIKRINVEGVRVTPNVYTTTEELDAFVQALKVLSGNA
ncbi:MAG: aminotransferase class V-fold PLP-dependent enzyme [Cytophagales bacterium]|nr:aminotransferase class V-fold PLP-dependent enzyme [Cytophagales bacterium]